MRVEATDLYLSVSGSCAADVRQQGAYAVDAKQLLERISAMPDGPVLLCEGSIRIGWVDAERHRPARIPLTVLEALT